MLRESSPTSTNTGRAPTRTMTFAVATKLKAGVMTSSPSPMPHAQHDDTDPHDALAVRHFAEQPPRESDVQHVPQREQRISLTHRHARQADQPHDDTQPVGAQRIP